jgi:hypothetical protein
MKVAVRIFVTGPKIEVAIAGGAGFRAFMLYQNNSNRYGGNIKMYVTDTAWEKCEIYPG